MLLPSYVGQKNVDVVAMLCVPEESGCRCQVVCSGPCIPVKSLFERMSASIDESAAYEAGRGPAQKQDGHQ